jgi:hypothetical protein
MHPLLAGPLLSEPAGNPSGGHADYQTDACGHREGLQRLTLHVMDTLVFDVFQPLDTALHRFLDGPFASWALSSIASYAKDLTSRASCDTCAAC